MSDDENAYRERYVAFLDLLGFSELVRRAEDTATREKIERLIHHLSSVPSNFKAVEFTQFSDCVVLSTDKIDGGLMRILMASRLIAECVMLEGVLTRGGIASGKLTHNDTLVYGPGLLNAHQYDKSATPPRIVVAHEIAAELGGENEWLRLFVRTDESDGVCYLHTLVAVEHFDPDDDPVPFPSAIWRMPEIVIAMCDGPGIPTSVRSKWSWFRAYWNATVGARLGVYC